MTGVEVIAEARRRGLHVPVLMLTARDTTSDRISGLNSGADDYLVKPFDFGELLARLRALQRRPAVSIGPRLECGDLVFDPGARQATVSGDPISLTVTEMGLLEVLLRRSPSVVTRRAMAAPRVGRRSRRGRIQHHRRPRGEAAVQAPGKSGPDRDGPRHRLPDGGLVNGYGRH